ncbi:hypothetical protein B0T16DRAFT_216887 [Cercophora newfieldiana]|uniref:Uncharacterized protein n=1 Tax=Cercophora newfieldiana TaxID=92897 RepID=A0AA39XWK0_9PEZI|nr:hypothetical protein B0T16DRAFT_216887 [Cercophora newfieldiana]
MGQQDNKLQHTAARCLAHWDGSGRQVEASSPDDPQECAWGWGFIESSFFILVGFSIPPPPSSTFAHLLSSRLDGRPHRTAQRKLQQQKGRKQGAAYAPSQATLLLLACGCWRGGKARVGTAECCGTREGRQNACAVVRTVQSSPGITIPHCSWGEPLASSWKQKGNPPTTQKLTEVLICHVYTHSRGSVVASQGTKGIIGAGFT